jgi:CxxC motif-containing protein
MKEPVLVKNITCIACPAGCRIEALYDGAKILSVSGNQCKKGVKFSEDEIINPRRILTTTVSINSASISRLPVRSNIGAPKDKIMQMVAELKKVKVQAPVKMGDVILRNILASGVDIISSFSVKN